MKCGHSVLPAKTGAISEVSWQLWVTVRVKISNESQRIEEELMLPMKNCFLVTVLFVQDFLFWWG